MRKRHLVFIHLLVIASTYVNCVQIDNELVSKPHSCFERIAIGAMLPFDKTFRRSDTNQLDVCTNLCLNDAECMTFAFGISTRGNGTCQLSVHVIDSTGSSPQGTIFDPDFDLYARKTSNCLVDPGPPVNNNNGGQFIRPGFEQQQPGNGYTNIPPARPTSSSFPTSPDSTRPNPTVFTSSTGYSTESGDGGGTTSSGDFQTSSLGSTFSSEVNPTRPDDLYNLNNNKFPTTYPTTNRNPQQNIGNQQPEISTNPNVNNNNPNYQNNNQNPNYQNNNQNPNYQNNNQNPNYQNNNQNPNYQNNNNQNSQRPPPPSNQQQHNFNHQQQNQNHNRPIIPPPHYASDRPDTHHAYPLGPDPFPDYFPQSQPHYHYHLDNYDDKNSHFPGIYAQNFQNAQPPMHHQHHPDRYHSQEHYGLYPAGRYPDSGINLSYNSNRKNGYQVTENVKDMVPMRPKTCFRRVLAGKRVASHWVRRTLICERLEDCQQQCSEERRFSCEGFNYRIDPNGRGQGECELVEVPLSQMDLYSSPHNRDLNLIPHPDYDYYERDRTTSNCRPNCIDCISNSNSNYLPSSNNDRPPPQQPSLSGYKPSSSSFESDRDRYRPDNTAIDKYRPQNHFYESRPGLESWDRYGSSNFYSGGGGSEHNYRPPPSSFGSDSRPPPSYGSDSRPPPSYGSDSRPPLSYGSDSRPSYGSDSRPPPYGPTTIDRYGVEENPTGPDFYNKPPPFRPPPSSSSSNTPNGYIDYHPPSVIPVQQPQKPYDRPPQQPPPRPISTDNYNRPLSPPQNIPQKPPSDYDRPDPPYSQSKPDSPPQQSYGGSSGSNNHPIQSPPPRPGLGYHEREPPSMHRPSPNYHPTNFHQKPSAGFIPYMIGSHENSWGTYGGTYGSVSYRPQMDYWGLKNEIKRIDGPQHFNYYELGPIEENSVYHRYGSSSPNPHSPPPPYGPMNFASMWTRRPGLEECSVKTSEGFRLHKGVVRNALTTTNLRECEKMCYSEDKFRCSVYSYRYSEPMRDNCLLCERSFSLLDSYADIVPDRNYDIYAMSDDMAVCKKEPLPHQQQQQQQQGVSSYGGGSNDQCFIRTIDHKRFFKAIVRDSLTVHSIKDCEIECIKAQKFTCRSFTFRYGTKTSGTIIDNCQLSDWPVRDMDHDRHLIPDDGFDVFERASYGRGCEIVPHDHNHQNPKLCYLGYGSAAKLLSSAIKKIISVSTELECKNECIRYRETSPFKCLSFSYGSQASTFNCEMSDLDQSELKLDVHYTHTPNRDFWLFAWNPWDYTCRDKITSISGNRINSDRRLDIFREPGGITTWKHYTVSGKPCRVGTKCEKNHIAGFYSCEIEGGEIGSWDFCCREDHPCGYSRDFDYPWCYVGVEKEQWRSCSVSYIPVNTQQHHQQQPQQQHQYQGAFSSDSYIATKYPNKKHDIYQSPPRPGLGFTRDLKAYQSQLHPLQYLYYEGPPNSTEISSNVIDCNRDRC